MEFEVILGLMNWMGRWRGQVGEGDWERVSFGVVVLDVMSLGFGIW